MKVASIAVIAALAVAASPALAQPGATDPSPPGPGQGAPPPPPGPPPSGMPPPGQVPPGAWEAHPAMTGDADIDAAIARAAASSPTLARIVRGAFRRARRSIALGPTVGMWTGRVPAQSDNVSALTFGVGLEKFDIPVLPSFEALQTLVADHAKQKVKEQLLRVAQGQPIEEMQFASLVQDAYEEAVKEVLDLEHLRPKTVEPPSFSLAFEVDKLFSPSAWQPRLRLGIGVLDKVTVGVSVATAFGLDGYAKRPAYTGLELVGHFQTSRAPRSSVVDLFLRADFEVRNRDTNTDMIQIGARFLFDII